MKTCKADNCNNPVFGKGYCKWHQHLRNDFKARRETISTNSIHTSTRKKIMPKKASNTGELDLFKQLWHDSPKVSELSGKQLYKFNVRCFHHLLTKQAYPQYRLDPENIVLLTPSEHRQVHDYCWEDLISKDKRWENIHKKYIHMKDKHGKENNS